MPRRLRLSPYGIAQHIIRRDNNRQVFFASYDGIAAYAHWLYEVAKKYQVQIPTWVFMTNHIHLLATPTGEDGISNMMQCLGRYYVRYFNRAYRRTGTLMGRPL
ncbi:MAG: putative transposase [Cellvibrionaceae bacterium]|jgi:putative transposase